MTEKKLPSTTRLNESSEITIPVRNLLALVVATGAFVMGYFNITERLNFLEHNNELISIQVDANSEFRTLWPRGELGSLPDDAEQNLRLMYLEGMINEIEEEIDLMRRSYGRLE
jgi:hypothetical protein